MIKRLNYAILAFAITLLNITIAKAQTSGVLYGQDTSRRVITTAVPFLNFAPDSRASGMGDVGVATSPDANSAHWNNGKLAFIDQDYGFSASYTPWLGKIVDDMSISYLSGFYKIDRVQTIGTSLRYFDLGEIQLTNEQGISLGLENPRELAFDMTYSRKLSEYIGVGVTGRYIWSNLSGSYSGNNGAKSGKSVAVDLGFYFDKKYIVGGKDTEVSFGAHISNIGQKITYSNETNADFIPTNLRLGSAYKTSLDPYNTITFALDFNKLLVPTPPLVDSNGNIVRGRDANRNLLSGIFGSFSDAPDGFSEELREITISAGAEYWYRDVFAARAGYFHETANKGGRKYITVGLGFRYQKFGVDFSYLIPPEQNHPLAETIRFSILFNFDRGIDDSESISN
ncbi:type IX secretion system outer membrane channel protein PorV [Reichenbachiella sp. MALMAid0571]|uniref:type IX secretion system outer membrane channel protein PorV n=1 Tax=Reichenbachiella sp. MALMAid0571 TaxID=3143939 RepID=UPI0032DF09BC